MTPGGPATSEMVGRTCPYCRFRLEQGVNVIACPACEAIHHDDCWSENGGCAVALCAGGPSRADASQQEEQQAERYPHSPDAAPPQVPPQPMPVVIAPDPSEAPTLKSDRVPPPPPTPPPGPPPPQGGGASRAAWVPLISVAIVLLGGAGAAAIVLANGSSDTADITTAETASEGFEEEEFEEEEEEGFGEEEEFEEEELEEEELEEEFEEPEPTPSPSQLAQGQIQHDLTAHFDRLASGEYESAYYDLTAREGEAAGGESSWVAAQEEDELQSFYLTVETSLADAHTAQASIVEFETHAVATGCNRWSGYWEMRKVYGDWLIDSAKLEKESC